MAPSSSLSSPSGGTGSGSGSGGKKQASLMSMWGGLVGTTSGSGSGNGRNSSSRARARPPAKKSKLKLNPKSKKNGSERSAERQRQKEKQKQKDKEKAPPPQCSRDLEMECDDEDNEEVIHADEDVHEEEVETEAAQTAATTKSKKSSDAKYRIGTVVKKRNRLEDHQDELSNDPSFATGKIIQYDSLKHMYKVQLQLSTSTSKSTSTSSKLKLKSKSKSSESRTKTKTKMELWTEREVSWGITLHNMIGRLVQKQFDIDGTMQLFQGSVRDVMVESQSESELNDNDDDDKRVQQVLYRVVYEDGDFEDLDERELEKLLVPQTEVENQEEKEKSVAQKKQKRKQPQEPSKSKSSSTSKSAGTPNASSSQVKKRRIVLLDSDDDDGDDEKDAMSAEEQPQDVPMDVDNDDDDDDDDDDGDVKHGKKKTSTSSTTTAATTTSSSSSSSSKRARRSKSKIMSYFIKDSDDESNDDDDEFETAKTKRTKQERNGKDTKGGTSNSSKKRKKQQQRIAESESEAEFELEDDDDDGDDDDELDSDIVMIDDDDDEEEDVMMVESTKSKSKAKTTTTKKKKSSATDTAAKSKSKATISTAAAADEDEDDDAKFERMSQGNAELKALIRKTYHKEKPRNNAQQLPEAGPYVEPVGIDATDGIVEGIISTMVRKVGKLLLASIAMPDDEKEEGELPFPLKLQTACSGTDAPSIGLGLIQECLDQLQLKDLKTPHNFQYEHLMSCEIEAFKQSYIGRNFRGVLLFPDITKLTGSDKVVDVYGREQTIPDGNFFVAGTSCKDFSMLKSAHRKDIEDKGTSGETFLAAVEFLDEKQPNMAIFENVDKAPWEKMQEYIRGRLQLRNRNDTKNITGMNKGNAEKDLLFSIDPSTGKYVAEKVPKQVGIRAGGIVQGFVRGGDDNDPSDVIPLRADAATKSKFKNNKTLTLGQLAKLHGIELNEDILVMEKKVRYCTHLVKLDTKEYGLPQTRNRKYLFIWKSDDPADNLGEYLQQIMDYLKTPLLHSMEAFLLPDTHDRIRCFREALRSGPGLMVARDRAKELDFFDFGLTGVKDLALHLIYRDIHNLPEKSRWLTQWDTRGRIKVAPGLWPELVAMWNMRRKDLIDSFAGVAMRDNFSRDPLHHSFTWDLSQNVTRTSVRSATVGVSGCVTPGGELLMPHKGRTLMGYEKLLLQGIPFSRLLLGPETEVQLSDLAGNAMSVPVIVATMLAAICAPQLRREVEKNPKLDVSNFSISQKYDSSNGAVLAERGDLYDIERDVDSQSFEDIFTRIAQDMGDDAYYSSVLCNCESSGRTTQDKKILQCAGCGFGICGTCSDLHQIESHDLKEIEKCHKVEERVDPHQFEMKLRRAVPSSLRLGENWEDTIPDCEGLESYSFLLQQVERKRGHWQLNYAAREDHGSGRQVAEIRVAIGQYDTLDSRVGLAAFVKCFAPAIRHVKPKRGVLRDSARLIMKLENGRVVGTPVWEKQAKNMKTNLMIVGSDPCPSQRVLVGLDDGAEKSLKGHTPSRKTFIPNIKSRNHVLHYHRKWKTWPAQIIISGDESEVVNGTYKKMNCQQTVVLSALWRREATGNSPPLYIYIRPDVIRSGIDVAVISLTPSYKDKREICELIDWIPENALVDKTYNTEVSFLRWDDASQLSLSVPPPNMEMASAMPNFHNEIVEKETKSAVVCQMKGLSTEMINSLLQHTKVGSSNPTISLDLVGKSGTQNAKRLSIVAAPSLLKSAAEDKLSLTLSKWYNIQTSSKDTFGLDEVYFPSRPVEEWVKKADQKAKSLYERVYDPEESNEYYHKLLNRPRAFQVNIDKKMKTLTVEMNPHVALHQASAYLLRGRGLERDYSKALDVKYCLSELSSMGEPDTKEFQVPNSDAYEEAIVEGLKLPLYPRQAKALTRMQAIEAGEVLFTEEERSEHVLGGVGWCLIGRAAKRTPLRGGVLGDAIGSGKTVVTIALILSGIEKARKSRNTAEGKSGATLIVVPPGLVKQWDDERKKFTEDKLKCITIDCTRTLMRYSIRDICRADIVIVPAGIIEERVGAKKRPYTEQLSKKSCAGTIPAAPSFYSQREAPSIEGTWVRNMASGPSIYVGNNGKQRTRDEQAYYGHCYSEAIKKLRKRKFSESERGVPLEYFTWERVIIDECHETLVTASANETKAEDFKAQARRGAREFLGVSHTDASTRPLVAKTAVWGLTGTPLLETEARVTELANLMGGTYLTGSAHHWRKEERESGRDLFLNQQEGSKSREYRCAVQESCHAYVREACQRNRGSKLDVKLERKIVEVKMTQSEGAKFLSEIKANELESFSINPEQLGERTSHALSVTASSKARHRALFEVIDSIQSDEPNTKIIVFANAFYGGHASALSALKSSGRRFCHISDSHSVHEQNEFISWFRHSDATAEDRKRPRILLLSFEQAAGHNLQEACHHVIMYDPMYSGADAVADASVEEQALGRVMRQGQKHDVTVTRIVVKGPNGERCLDDVIVERNLDEDVLRAATSNFD